MKVLSCTAVVLYRPRVYCTHSRYNWGKVEGRQMIIHTGCTAVLLSEWLHETK